MHGYAVIRYADGTTGFRTVTSEDDLLLGETFATEPPPPTMADAATALTYAVQTWLDATAQGNGYDSIASCISYRGSSVAQWDTDASRALAWRDAVWLAAFQWQQDALANPPATFPTAAEVIATLPQPDAYGWVQHAPGQA